MNNPQLTSIDATSPRRVSRKRRIGFLLFDGVKTLDFVGPAEVFVEANQAVDDYEIVLMSPDGRDVHTSIGASVSVQSSAADGGTFDTVIIPGSELPGEAFATPWVLNAAMGLAARTRRLTSICSGAYILAHIGALDGRRATTHWKFADQLAHEFPLVQVEADSIFIRDGHVYTSAGVAAGIDLALALVEEDHGADVARTVSQLLLVYMKRSGGQSQFSASLRAKPAQKSIVRQVVELIETDPSLQYTTEELARQVRVSSRHLARLFHEEFGSTPSAYVHLLRFDLARLSLESGHNVTEAASQSGFVSPEALRRSFVAKLGVSPSKYQKRFLSTSLNSSEYLLDQDATRLVGSAR